FIRDMQSGVTRLVSVNSAGTDSGNGASGFAMMTPDARFIIFTSVATNLATTPDTNGVTDVFVRDMQSGVTSLVSVNAAGTASSNDLSYTSGIESISADGRFVAFESYASDLVGPPDGRFKSDVYVRDMQAGVTSLLSINSAGTGRG